MPADADRPYRVVYPEAIRSEIRRIVSLLVHKGYAKKDLAACLQRLDRQLREVPDEFGEHHFHLRKAGLVVGYCFVAPIGFEYGIRQDERVIFIQRAASSPPV